MRAHVFLLVASISLSLVAAQEPWTATTGGTRDAPNVEAPCEDAYTTGDVDPADPINGTTIWPNDPALDICSVWLTSHWGGTAEEPVLTGVTFGLQTAADIRVLPNHAYSFEWGNAAVADPDADPAERCDYALHVVERGNGPEVAFTHHEHEFRSEASPCRWRGTTFLLTDVFGLDSPFDGSGGAAVSVDGSVLEVHVALHAADPVLQDAIAENDLLEGLQAWSRHPGLAWVGDCVHVADARMAAPEA